MPARTLIVLGASTGGIQATSDLLGRLPADLPAAIAIVIHTSPTGPGLLPDIMARISPLSVKVADEASRSGRAASTSRSRTCTC